MAVSEELSGFVKESLGRGLPPAQIEDALRRAGWTTEQVRAALAGFAQIDFPIPVPRPTTYLSAREAFQYLVVFATLYISAYNLGNLFFEMIDHWLPDPADVAGDYARQAIRWSVSSLIVAFPVFLYASWVTTRAIQADPNKRASMVRRWLTYLTLFNAAGFLLGDVITLVYNLLGGELTGRFMLKALTVAVIAGATFGYYLSDLRVDEKAPAP
jgi:hypothetical protein